jgi:hypothetical protein
MGFGDAGHEVTLWEGAFNEGGDQDFKICGHENTFLIIRDSTQTLQVADINLPNFVFVR